MQLSKAYIGALVERSLQEDVGSGDLTVQLIPADKIVRAGILTREAMVVCGQQFIEQTFLNLTPEMQLDWQVKESQLVEANTILLTLHGNARAMLTAERTALNFLQMLSGVATQTRAYVDQVAHTPCRILDTRKTIPNLRLAQKYAVYCGGGNNHRIGLFDAFLIKENHIKACGAISIAVEQARQIAPDKLLEVEVENLDELQQAIEAQVDRIMLDNFTLEDMRQAVKLTAGKVPLEVSGNVGLDTVRGIAETGVDFISIGSLTKHIHAIDLSMRVLS